MATHRDDYDEMREELDELAERDAHAEVEADARASKAPAADAVEAFYSELRERAERRG